MLSLSKTMGNPHEEYLEHIEHSKGFVAIDYTKISSRMLSTELSLTSMRRQLLDIYERYTGRRDKITRKYIIDLLLAMGIPESKLKEYPTSEGLSIRRATIMEPLSRDKTVNKEFIIPYLTYGKEFAQLSAVKKKMSRCEKVGYKNRFTDTYVKMFFTTEVQKTGRIYTRNENVQGIPHDYLDCLVPEKGKILLGFDLDQIDFRVLSSLFLNTEQHASLKGLLSRHADSYEAFARYIHEILGRSFNYETFKLERANYKTIALAGSYGQSPEMMVNILDDLEVCQAVRTLFDTSDKYIELKEEVKNAAEDAATVTFVSYFGREMEEPLQDPSSGHESSDKNMRLAISHPMQATSTHIKEFIVNYVMREFKKIYGDKVLDFINIYLDRHDEVIFSADRDVLNYSHIFKNTERVMVDDWIPLTTSWEVYGYYKEIDLDLQSALENFDESKLNTEHVVQHIDYNPVRGVCKLHLVTYFDSHYFKLGNVIYKYPRKAMSQSDLMIEIREVSKSLAKKLGQNEYTIYFSNADIQDFLIDMKTVVSFEKTRTKDTINLLYDLRNGNDIGEVKEVSVD